MRPLGARGQVKMKVNRVVEWRLFFFKDSHP